jgi:hypothetical protein
MRVTFRWVVFPVSFAFTVALFAAVPSSHPQATAAGSEAQNATRACAANPVLEPTGKKKAAHKPKHPLPPEVAPVCIEVKGEPIEVQEFLQAFARDQEWRSGEHHASEDTWSFVRYLNFEELEKYADTKVLIESVKFSSGKAAVVVRTSDAGGGYVRVQITARFQGEGQSEDKVMAQPGSIWTLMSRGVFEQELVGALKARKGRAE